MASEAFGEGGQQVGGAAGFTSRPLTAAHGVRSTAARRPASVDVSAAAASSAAASAVSDAPGTRSSIVQWKRLRG